MMSSNIRERCFSSIFSRNSSMVTLNSSILQARKTQVALQEWSLITKQEYDYNNTEEQRRAETELTKYL